MHTSSRRKQYVEVLATHYIDGGVRPRTIIFADGKTFEIEEVKGSVRAKTGRAGEIVLRYHIVIRGKETYLYCDCGRYFVEMREDSS